MSGPVAILHGTLQNAWAGAAAQAGEQPRQDGHCSCMGDTTARSTQPVNSCSVHWDLHREHRPLPHHTPEQGAGISTTSHSRPAAAVPAPAPTDSSGVHQNWHICHHTAPVVQPSSGQPHRHLCWGRSHALPAPLVTPIRQQRPHVRAARPGPQGSCAHGLLGHHPCVSPPRHWGHSPTRHHHQHQPHPAAAGAYELQKAAGGRQPPPQ
jgi:hypothetical protein